MLFNSYEFLFVFLPIGFVLFWYGGRSIQWRLLLLTLASYGFYSWWQFSSWEQFVGTFVPRSFQEVRESLWQWRFTLIMFFSSSVDYWAAKWMTRLSEENRSARRGLLALSLTINLGLLGFFKYFGFFTQIADELSRSFGGGSLPIVAMILPVGISFYTFESMSYVIDIYRGVAKPASSYLDYACFISFFPHLVAGPIIRYSDMLHQFRDVNWIRPHPDWDQVNRGLLFLTIGMVKKLLIADALAARSNPLWDALGAGTPLGIVGSWAAVVGYGFRLYFDFSGYSDMAVGLGHLFAVRLPQNFNSPYKACDPSDFWRRWHISLSSWLRDYLYIPLGGNRNGRQGRNLMITMVLCGLWHGAAWLFVIFGAWWGLVLVLFQKAKHWNLVPSNDRWLGCWFNRQVTFLLVFVGWAIFRSADVHSGVSFVSSIQPAIDMLGAMAGCQGVDAAPSVPIFGPKLWLFLAGCWAWCNFVPNSFEVVYAVRPRACHALAAGTALALCILKLGAPVDFLYFRF